MGRELERMKAELCPILQRKAVKINTKESKYFGP